MISAILAGLTLLFLAGCGETTPPVDAPENSADAAGRVSETAMKAHFLRIRMASDRFRSVNGAYPTDVSQLVEGGFIHAGQELDPWDRPYALHVEEGRLVITSYGADGKPGGTEHNQDRVSYGVELR